MTSRPSISVVLPAYNAENPLPKCLSSLRHQDYPQDKIELIVIDDNSEDNTVSLAKKFGARVVSNGARHIETGKAIGIKHASHEYILFLDADNYFSSPSWISEAVAALEEDPSLVGAQSARFAYSSSDPAANRYCSLMGINDPMAFYLKRRDRLTAWEESWDLMGDITEDRGHYWKILFSPQNVPTLGSQGFLTRKSLINKTAHWPLYFHMDTNFELISKGHNTYALLKQPIGHDHCTSSTVFIKKCLRNLDLYFRYQNQRKFTWVSSRFGFLFTVLCMVTIIRPALDALRGFISKPDLAWLLHPWLSFCIPILYTAKTILHKIRPSPQI